MATSGSFSTGAVGNFYFTFEWWRTGYDSSKNEHYIHYVIKTHNTLGNYRTVYERNLYINGGLIYSDGGGVPMYDNEILAEGNFTIGSYNDSGDGSFRAYFEAGVGISSGANCSGEGSWGLDRIPRYANLTKLEVERSTTDSITLSYTTDRNAWLFVNLNNGQGWLNGGQPVASNTTSGEITINYKDRANTQKLDYNTTYNITVLCRAISRDSNIDTSRNITASTKDKARINKLNNLIHGDNININITNPANISNLNLAMSIGNTQIFSKQVNTGNSTIMLSDTELDNLYKKYGSSNSKTATFDLTGNNYTDSKTCEVILTGNQKTTHLKTDEWKRAKVWVKKNKTWKRAVVWTCESTGWKRGI